jgi:putative hemolysin
MEGLAMASGKSAFKQPATSKGTREALTVWAQRQKRQGVDWKTLNIISLKGALVTCLSAGGALMFSQAAGGLGVCLTLFDGDARAKEYASTNEELEQLLEQVIDFCESSSEDVRQMLTTGFAVEVQAD